MLKRLMLGILLATKALASTTVPVKVYAFSETVGRKTFTYTTAEQGYLAWMRGGYKTLGCADANFSEFYQTPCMVQVLFTAMEKSLKDDGVDVHFDYQLNYTDFAGYDVTCLPNSRCVAENARVWKEKNADPGLDVLLLPLADSVQGQTRTVADIRNGKTVVGLVAGKSQSYMTAHLFRHEMAHALGFGMHLYDPDAWTFNADNAYKCPQIVVQPYEKSGLARGCQNMTFLGSYINNGQVCSAMSMNDPKIYDERFNVPLYGPIFHDIFTCWLAENIGQPSNNDQICKNLMEQVLKLGCIK